MRREGHSRALSTAPPQPRDNRLFAALPPEDAARLLPHLTPVTWTLGTVLYAPHHAPAYLYFPTTALVSLAYTMADGLTVDMGVVGHEGVVGLALFMGGATMPHQALVRVAGDAFRLPAKALHAEFQRGGAFQRALLRSTQALLTQIAQTAVCNRAYTHLPAAVPVAAVHPRPGAEQRDTAHPRSPRPDVSRAPRDRDGHGAASPSGGADLLWPGPHRDCGPPGPGSAGMRVLSGSAGRVHTAAGVGPGGAGSVQCRRHRASASTTAPCCACGAPWHRQRSAATMLYVAAIDLLSETPKPLVCPHMSAP